MSNDTNSRFPNLGKLSIAIIENWAESVIGKNAVSEIKSPVAEKELRDSIFKALSKTEKRFLSEHPDSEVCEAIVNLPLANLPSVLHAARDFYASPTDNGLEQVLNEQLAINFARVINAERLGFGVSSYLNILRQEFAMLSSEIREKINTEASLSVQKNTEQVVILLEQLLQVLSKIRFAKTEQEVNQKLYREIRMGLRERKNLKVLGESVYEAEALYSEGKLPNDLAPLLQSARDAYDEIRRVLGELTTLMRFGDLEARKQARDEIARRVSQGEQYLYDVTTNKLRPSYEMLREANILLEQISEETTQYILDTVNSNLSSHPFYVAQLLRDKLELPLQDFHKRKLELKLQEVELHLRSQEQSVVRFVENELTKKEQDMAKLAIANDWTSHQISKELNVSISIVDIQLNQICEKVKNHFGLEQVNLTILATILGSYFRNQKAGYR